jgi:phosphoribosyl 1,2-cyclic phosphodiesterase
MSASDSDSDSSLHNNSIISQFTKQAIPYSKRHNISNENELKQLVELINVKRNDIVLDLIILYQEPVTSILPYL